MTLKTLQSEMVSAMKSGDKFRKGVISVVIAQIKNAAIDKGCRDDISEDMVNAELLKAKKTTQEMIDTCPASRTDLLDDYKKQMEIICEFAPKLITDETEIGILIDNVLEDIEPIKENRGKIMKAMSQYKGKVDMSVVNRIVGRVLS